MRLAAPPHPIQRASFGPLGDSLRPVEPEDIRRAGKLMYVTAALVLVLFGAAKAAVIFVL